MIAATVSTTASSSITPSAIVSLLNADRAQHGLASLAVNPVLAAIAQDKASDMAAKGYFAHTSPDGKSPWYWFDQEHYVFAYAGENLAVDFSNPDALESAWMDSPEHRANILNGDYAQVGIAVAVGTYEGHQTIFVAEEFGTPKATLAVAKPIATPPAATQTPAPASVRIAPLAAKTVAAKESTVAPAPTARVLAEASPAPVADAAATQTEHTVLPSSGAAPAAPSAIPLYVALAGGIAGLLFTLAARRPLHRAAPAKRR